MRKFLVSVAFALAALSAGTNANAQTATQDIIINATVTSFCTINGLTTGAAVAAATIPVAAGIVTTSAINYNIANVSCNNNADVIATSLSGGVKSAAAASPGVTTNIINYTAAATFSGATSTINTATVATAAASEAGNTATTASAATGALTVAITPAQPALPLVTGAYTDTLRVTLTAQ